MKLEDCIQYIDKNQDFFVNYGDCFRHGEPIATSFVEPAVNQVESKRFVRKKQMAWSDSDADGRLQIRTAVLIGELRRYFEYWYPSIAVNDERHTLAA